MFLFFFKLRNKNKLTLRLKFMQIQHKLFLIVCYEKCFCKSSDRGFFHVPELEMWFGNENMIADEFIRHKASKR
ncbi:CLUMA_CG016709, isoform A [Clunio marinus]|uniref:CLUMA_CG016709, isoform A n=1 Tax=Clunio marinus TaxID=568069 RepID=A0A1J1ITN2_9DIPT|nr:CLUMA_CG016709, isoform A [Clunio marinus]